MREYREQIALRLAKPGQGSWVDDKPLRGKVAIVTGASSGIGAAVARQLAQAGAKVAMAARREEKMAEVVREVEEAGGVAISVRTDVSQADQVKALVERVQYSLGPVDILVNNAGVMYFSTLAANRTAEWDLTVDVNCKGVMYCTGAVLPGMVERRAGHVVNITSDAGRRGFAGLAVYSGSKFFVEGLSQALRHEVKGQGIRVTCVQPGDVKTDLIHMSTDQQACAEFATSPDSPDWLQADDVARAVLYAVTQPPGVAVNEILVEPTASPI